MKIEKTKYKGNDNTYNLYKKKIKNTKNKMKTSENRKKTKKTCDFIILVVININMGKIKKNN